ncbi:carbohydrate sulfotransferase 9-like [Watersipora subatra]|uniref:carbohydrate sulfotransferase 9-like n=1 Tax=Watersipora subatra TaxID=2589382 RepID=UPI00355B9ABB
MRCIKFCKCIITLFLVVITFMILLSSVFFSQESHQKYDISHMRYSGLNVNRFENRLQLKSNHCRAVDKTSIAAPKTLLYSKAIQTIYCPVPYVFSTWFKHSMLQIESIPLKLKAMYNISTLQAVHSGALALNLKRSALMRPDRLASAPQSTIIIVRDPWQRLIAAYNDSIVQRRGYRTQCAKFRETLSGELKFEGFLRCLLHYANGSHSLHKLDVKLSPINTICSVCTVPYMVILKYESLGADLYDYIASMRSEAKDQFLKIYFNTAMPKGFPMDLTKAYVNSVNRRVILGIQQLYALDFKLFGYALR